MKTKILLALLVTISLTISGYFLMGKKVEPPKVVKPAHNGVVFKREVKVEPPFELKHEIYGDKEIFNMPRIQFVWRGPEQRRHEIWSIKVNGTDLRLAVDASLLYPENDNHTFFASFRPIRSPNNRYMLVNLMNENIMKAEVFLIDLKNKTRKKILNQGLIGLYPWTSDSKSFFYRGGDDFKRFYLENNLEKTIKHSTNRHIYVQQDKDQYWETEEDGVNLFDFNGKLIKSLKFEGMVDFTHNISANGKYLVYRKREGMFFVFLDDINKIKKINVNKNIMIMDSGDFIYEGSLNKMYRYNVTNDKDEIFYNKYGGDDYSYKSGSKMSRFTMINQGSVNVQK